MRCMLPGRLLGGGPLARKEKELIVCSGCAGGFSAKVAKSADSLLICEETL